MPTNLFGFRFMFNANDHEPIHVHVIIGESDIKVDFPAADYVGNQHYVFNIKETIID